MKKTVQLITIVIAIQLTMSYTKSDEWFMLESKSFGFKIEFPEEPTARIQEVNSGTNILKMNMFMYDVTKTRKKDDNLVYLINYTVYPDSSIKSNDKEVLQNFYRSSIDATVENVHGKILSEKIITLKGYSGREVRIDFKDGLAVINMRLFLIKNKMYMMEIITETKNDFNLSIKRFMDSFELLN